MHYLDTNTPVLHFQKTLKAEIYVDKSIMIEFVNKMIGKPDGYICITRPRRFGKTINANMLGAYYSYGFHSDALFADLEIAKSASYKEHLNRHHVIYMDFASLPDVCGGYQDYIMSIIRRLREDLAEYFPILTRKNYESVSDMLRASGEQFIFIIDEWDYIFSQKFLDQDDRSHFLQFLKGLFKDQPYVELVYMTGVLPIAKYSSGSELNMFDEYNFMNDNLFDRYFGFREEEVRALCREHTAVSFEDMKRWYDGYYTFDGKSLFNPRSVCKALLRGVCLNYWTETGPMDEIAECVEHNVGEVREDIVKMVAGEAVSVRLRGYSAVERQLNNRDEILSAMVVYGFLSYYDGYLRIPNYELMEKYEDVLSRDSMGEVKEIVDASKEMLRATLAGEAGKVAAMLELAHDREIPFLKYNDENSLSCVITLCYLYARNEYWVERELAAGKGRCDYIFVPKKPGKAAIILELKRGQTAEEAISQIKRLRYTDRVKNCGEIILVGINYDGKKRHTCVIETIYNDQA